MAERIMYVKPACPYCEQAREGLAAEGKTWEERDATSRPEWRAELMRYSKNSGKVPTIVVGDEVESVGWKGGG
ncbi:MAG TPA: glutaredoxin family protein [Solirubrobacteraceae bacterium]|nr:glutaredoxin family protein [Solirubrobacteraceae bacterium]